MKTTTNDLDSLTDKELARAIELLVSPDQLMSRDVMCGIIGSLGFTPEEVCEQLTENEPLNDGPMIRWNFCNTK
jgi:hypothetical protein